MGNTYKLEKELKEKQKISELEQELPKFVSMFANNYLSIRNASTTTVLNYLYDIRVFLYYLTTIDPEITIQSITPQYLESLSYETLQNYAGFLHAYEFEGVYHTNGEQGVKRKFAAARSLYRFLQSTTGLISNNPIASIQISSFRKHKKNIVHLEENEIEAVMDNLEAKSGFSQKQIACNEKTKYRDTAIMKLLLGTGIRVSELVGIDIKNIKFDNNSIEIVRKGGSESYVFFNDNVKEALSDYINLERKVLLHIDIDQNDTEPALFISQKGGRLTQRSVERLVKKYTQTAVPGKNITPHGMRRTYGTELYRNSGDIHLTADALGHSSIAVTAAHYADIGTERRKEASEYTRNWI